MLQAAKKPSSSLRPSKAGQLKLAAQAKIVKMKEYNSIYMKRKNMEPQQSKLEVSKKEGTIESTKEEQKTENVKEEIKKEEVTNWTG